MTATPSTGLAPILLEDSQAQIAISGLRRFGARLNRSFFRSNATPAANTGFSPVGLIVSLGMLATTADGATQERFAKSLAVSATGFHPSLHWLQTTITESGRDPNAGDCPLARACDKRDVQQTILGNGVWFQPQPIRSELSNSLRTHYGAELGRVTPSVQQDIRKWVDQKTLGLIPDFLEDVGPSDSCVLVNTVYFSARWRQTFAPEADLDFTDLQKRSGKVKASRGHWNDGHYLQNADFQAVTLPYAGEKVQALLVLPRAGRFERVGRQLMSGAIDPQTLLLDSRTSSRLDVTIPDFEARSRLEDLQELLDAATDGAVTQGEYAYFEGQPFTATAPRIVQRVSMRVDEKGTAATAATMVVLMPISAEISKNPRKPPPLVVVRVERPFFFFVRLATTGVVLFAAQVVQPIWLGQSGAKDVN
jgi:serpin B